MGKYKMRIQVGTKGKGRGKKRKCDDSDASNGEEAAPMKLKIRIGGNRFKKKEEVVKRNDEEDEDEIIYDEVECPVEEEVVNDEFVVEQSLEHFEPDAGYFEEVVNQDDDDDNNDDGGDDDDVGGGGDDDVEDEDERIVQRSRNNPWGVNDEEDEDDGGDDDDDDKERVDGLSDDERKWLDALESGQLNENGEVKHLGRSNVPLTARQRALLYGEKIEDLLELSSIQPAEMTEEQLMKRKKKAMRRKQLEVEKIERDKKETLDRLLKKQDSKLKTCKSAPNKDHLNDIPHFRYSNNCTGVHISVPHGWEFPLEKKSVVQIKTTTKCGVDGCSNDKKYSCSKTNVPLCSLECYKKNLSSSSSSLPTSSSSLPTSSSSLPSSSSSSPMPELVRSTLHLATVC